MRLHAPHMAARREAAREVGDILFFRHTQRDTQIIHYSMIDIIFTNLNITKNSIAVVLVDFKK